MRKHSIVVALVILFSELVLAQQAMNNEGVAKMVKAGLSEDIIVATITSSPGSYNTTADALIALKTAGASDKIISAVLSKSSSVSAPSAAGLAKPDSQATAVQEPELMGKLFYLSPDTKTFTQLPGEQWKRKTKAGLVTVKAENIVAGDRSSFRITSKDKMEFVFKPVPDQGSFNAIQGIKLYPFEVRNGERVCIVQEQKGRTREGNRGVISFDIAKYGASSYVLTPTETHLAPGEYWIMVPGASSFNDPLITFGVD